MLVPIDFSAGSASALRYAEALAVSIGVKVVKAIYVFTPQTASADAISAMPVGELMDQSEKSMQHFLNDIPVPKGIHRSRELLLGFAADKILDESKNFDLIVLGASGSSDLLEEVFGSVSSNVVEKATCPVLLIPREARFSNYGNILYASNNLSLSRRVVLKFREFNELFHARVHFVHVKEENDRKPLDRQEIFSKLFATPDPSFSFDIREVEAGSVQEGLVAYLERHPIDLAVMVTKRRSFWSRLFNHSDTRQLVLHPSTPMMVMHAVE